MIGGIAALTAHAAEIPRLATAPVPAGSTSLDEPLVMQLRPLEVTVNGAAVGNWLLLDRNGSLYAPPEAIEEWRLQQKTRAASLQYRGQEWVPLATFPGYTAQFNLAEQSVAIKFAVEAFAATRLVQEKSERPALTPSIPSAFLNYDWSFTRSSARGANTAMDLGALVEAGTSGTWGLLTSTFLLRNLTNSNLQEPRGLLRLETNYTRDFPDSDLTLRIGDSITRPASWGRSVFFGGVQIGTNFGLTPGFISQPLPIISGLSAAPSTVDLYINDALRQTSQVPAGPFAIDNFPLLTGGGQARMVVRDVLGRETVIVQDFFSHSSLLERGLNDWSVEAGAVRSGLGERSRDYRQLFASGLWRRGMSKSLTLEGKLEFGQSTRGAGVGVVAGLPFQLLAQAGLAASTNSSVGAGHLWQAAVTHTGAQHGFSVNMQVASASYRQTGQDDTAATASRQLQTSYNYQLGPWGQLGAGLALLDNGDRRIVTYNLNYSVQLGKSTLTLNAVQTRDPSRTGNGTSLGASLFVPLDSRINTSSNVTHHGGRTETYVSASRGLDAEQGMGWRALAGYKENEPYAEGGVYLQSPRMLSTMDISQSASRQTLRVGAQGGLAVADGEFFATRRITDSFAVVEVPGYPDVGISLFGGVVTRTDAAGRAIVSRLLPYSANDIRLDPTELPISAELDTIEQRTVPASRSAVKIVFPVRTGRGALVRIVFEDGGAAPAGAELELVGDKHEFFVARRGEAFVTGLRDSNEVKLKWNDQVCTLAVQLPPGNPDDIARVGPLVCAGVKR
ncbi:MAG: fimbrial biosis outer rane usher protein [Ramlibacter sp.]|nr:fimbrial biosis outer rane usher protein [Ramlibacter sp.]